MSAATISAFEPIAIVGMSCLFPKAGDLEAYWNLLLNGVDAIGPIPPTHWHPDDYFDADPKKPDHTYARTGGFIDPVDYPPLEFGVAPNALPAIDTTQLLGLWVARAALRDAGYGEAAEFDRGRVSVILGVTGTLELVIPLGARLGHPHWKRAMREAGIPEDTAAQVVERIGQAYVPWQEDSFPGLLGNVVAGRIANRLNLGGTNCVVDAACASSLSAIHLAALELGARRADVVVAGGMDTFNDIFMYMCFSKTPALSPTGHARPFDHHGDGTILGEGLGCVILKRLVDAEHAGDRIYAVLRGLGSSSDGKGQAIYAPSPAGQARALREAYALAGVSPDTIELVEAHGTGTRAGDLAEITALNEVYRASGKAGPWCALGSVKSQIGHTKAAAGAAGLMKAALALYHRVQPPTLKVERPLEPLQADHSPFRVNAEPRPWLAADHPRRAAVSAFGFGGSNFHAVLEEYPTAAPGIAWDPDVQLVALSSDSPDGLVECVGNWCVQATSAFRDAARQAREAFRSEHAFRLTFCATSATLDVDALRTWIGTWRGQPVACPTLRLGSMVIHLAVSPARERVGFLFPGQGSQYVGMLRELACRFPAMQEALAEANRPMREQRLSDAIYPFTAFTTAEKDAQAEALRNTATAQPALAAVEWGLVEVLRGFGLRSDAVAGHSFGELTALAVAGVLSPASLFELARRRGELMAAHGDPNGTMLAVAADPDAVAEWLAAQSTPCIVANRNSPRQTILSGPRDELDRLRPGLRAAGWTVTPLPVSGAFHTAALQPASEGFHADLIRHAWHPMSIPVYANTTGAAYPTDRTQAQSLLARQLCQPVDWQQLIETMYAAGVRVFVEVGPKAVLSGMVAAILGERPHWVVPLDPSMGQRRGLVDLGMALAILAASGVPIQVAAWDPAPKVTGPAPAKPTFSVKIGGANLPPPPRAPRSVPQPAPALAAPRPPVSVTIPTEARSHGTASSESLPATSATPNGASRSRAHVSMQKPMTPTSHPAPEFLAVLHQITQQTAEVHRLFLESQDRSLAVLQQWLSGEAVARETLAPSLLPPTVPKPPTVAKPPSKPLPAPPPTNGHVDTPVVPIRRTEPGLAPRPTLASAPVLREPASSNGTPRHLGAADALLAIVGEKTGYPVEMLGLEMDLDADLGIDSIKRVEIFSAIQERLPHAPAIKAEHLGSFRKLRDVVEFLGYGDGTDTHAVPVAAPGQRQPSATTTPDTGELVSLLLSIVSEKTGYPVEMLGLEMHLDADLGIDSIKRVEIFSSLQERLPTAPAIKAEHLGRLQTLKDVADFLRNGAGPTHSRSDQNGLAHPEPGTARPEKKKP